MDQTGGRREPGRARARLTEIGELEGEALTAHIKAERERLVSEYGESERELRAARFAEDGERAARAASDGSGAEIDRLHRQASVSRYLHAAASGIDVAGVEAEHRSATWGDEAVSRATDIGRRQGGVIIPWSVLAGPERRTEHRADTATALATAGAQTVEDEWVGRVFSTEHAAWLGVDMKSAG